MLKYITNRFQVSTVIYNITVGCKDKANYNNNIIEKAVPKIRKYSKSSKGKLKTDL